MPGLRLHRRGGRSAHVNRGISRTEILVTEGLEVHLEHIILFSKIATEKSISKVAAASHISQPALSQQMQRLEEEVGIKLFERSNRGIELTEGGRVMQKYALQFMRTYENFKEEIGNLQNNSGTFRIAATNVAGNYAIPCTLFKIKNKFPTFTFSLASMPSSGVMRHVAEDQADVGFVVGAVEETGMVCKKSFSDKIFLVASKDYNVRESLSIQDLQHYPLIMLNEDFSSYRLLVSQFKARGYDMSDFKVLYHLDSTESVKASVIGKYGMAFLPYMAIKKEIYLGQIKLVEMPDFNLSYDVSIIYKSQNLQASNPISAVTKYFEHIVTTSIC